MYGYQLAVMLFLAFIKRNSAAESNWTTCEGRDPLICKCTKDTFIDVTARCHFYLMTDLRTIISYPQDLIRLNLSGNNFEQLLRYSFSNYSKLIYISLSSNNIHTIRQEAFSGLKRLQELNLEDNMIKQWDTTLIEQDLPNLIMLNVAQNTYWKPDQGILSLPRLKIIYLLLAFLPRNQDEICSYFRCHLVRIDAKINRTLFVEQFPRHFQQKVEPDFVRQIFSNCWGWQDKLYFRDNDYSSDIRKNEYYFHCAETLQPKCLFKKHLLRRVANVTGLKQRKKWFYIKHSLKHFCWNLINMILIIGLFEGICAIINNLIVIITTLRSRVLRESVAHALVANVAVGDLLTSFYMVIIASTRNAMSAVEYDDFYLPYYCRIVGLFFLMGQFSSPMMSFIMTLERYLAVVYCMRPHVRITRRKSFVAMAIVWSLSILPAVAAMTSKKFSTGTDSMCVPLPNINDMQVLYYAGGFGVILYIISMALYGHMYVDFQKTNQKTVQLQRENRLARKIALIIFTNLLFFIFPLVVISIVNGFKDYISATVLHVFWKTFGITVLGINPCINPIIFSFRNEQFRSEFRKLCCRTCGVSVAPQP